jgi:hypothetical protein
MTRAPVVPEKELSGRSRREVIVRWGLLRLGPAYAVLSTIQEELLKGDRLAENPLMSFLARLALNLVTEGIVMGLVFGWLLWHWSGGGIALPRRRKRG